MSDSLVTVLLFAGAIFLGLLAIGMVFARLYTRSSKEMSFVRTGFGGQRVIMNGGALVFPVLHQVVPVNMNTLRLEVHRANEQALITKDRMRVDAQVEFYVRVQPTEESIANAAQTLGRRTINPDDLKDLIEGKFVDALRAVAAEMAMEALHEQRVNFVQKVQAAVSEDILKNGLELESVSLTGLNQTNREYFNPQNAFDAEGLTKLTQAIEERRKIRNDIEQETQVLIERKNLDAEQQKFQISRDKEFARLDQEREIQMRAAEQSALIVRQKAEREREAEQAKIVAQQQVRESDIASAQIVAERDIEKQQAVEIGGGREDQADHPRRADARHRHRPEVAREVRRRCRGRQGPRHRRPHGASRDHRQRDRDRGTREADRADRGAQDRRAAGDRGDRRRRRREEGGRRPCRRGQGRRRGGRAEGEDRRRGGGAGREVPRRGSQRRLQRRSDGKRAVNEASNTLSAEQIAMQVRLALIQALPQIIAQSVKPLENIDGIKILHVEGLNGGGSHAANGDAGGGGSPTRRCPRRCATAARRR